MQIKVSYSFHHEVENYLNSLYRFGWLKHGRTDIQERLLRPFPKSFRSALRGAKNEQEAEEVIKTFLRSGLEQREKSYANVAKNLEQAWKKKGRAIEKSLEDLYDQPVPFNKVNIYLSSIPICPYNFNERWIMLFANTSQERQLQILTNELNHFMFHYYFGKLKVELGKQKFESLKEALTVFTNPEEKGYPAQRKLRAWLKKQTDKTIPQIISSGGWKRYI